MRFNRLQLCAWPILITAYYEVAILCRSTSARRDEAHVRRDGTKVRETVLDAPIDFLEHLIWLKSRNTFSDSEICFFCKSRRLLNLTAFRIDMICILCAASVINIVI